MLKLDKMLHPLNTESLHSYTTVDKHFGFNHGLVRKCEKGYRFVVEVDVGGGSDGHKLYLKDFHFECTAGRVDEASIRSSSMNLLDSDLPV